MNTTALFVEIIVIGAGGTIWLALLVLSVFGYNWIPWKEATSIVTLVPVLSLIYVLGIVIDRLADQLYSTWDKKLRKQEFSSNEEYHNARTYVYNYAPDRIISLFEYGRSRLRISRAWSINCLLLTICIPLLIWARFPKTPSSTQQAITIFGITVFGLGTIATFFAWKKLATNDYKRLFETYFFLRNEKSDGIQATKQTFPK